MNAINRYMRDKNVNRKLKLKICAYIQYYYKKQKSRDEGLEQVIISKLPPNLKEELIYQSHITIFEKVSWMKYFSEEFIKTLAFQIEEYHYPERDPIYCMGDDIDNDLSTQGLYFLKEGTAECYIPYSEGKTDDAVFEYQIASENGYGIDTLKQQRKKNLGLPIKSLKKDIYLRHLVKDQYFGETSIFLNEQIPFSVKSVDFSTVYKISRKNFIETIKKFPDDYEIYCEIKEKLEFRQKRTLYPKFNCEHCKMNHEIVNKDHQIIECPRLIPHLSIKQYDYCHVEQSNLIQFRDKNIKRSKLKRMSSLFKLNLIQSCARQAFQHFGDLLNNDDMSIMTNNLSFISETSQGAIIENENENESEIQDENEDYPKKYKRAQNKINTITEEVSTPQMFSLNNNEIPISSKQLNQNKIITGKRRTQELEDILNTGVQENQENNQQERSFTNILSEVEGIQPKEFNNLQQNHTQSERLQSEEQYQYQQQRSKSQIKDTFDQQQYLNEDMKRNRKRLHSAFVKVDKQQQQMKSGNISEWQKINQDHTPTQSLGIQNMLENYFSEFRQILYSELIKYKSGQAPSQFKNINHQIQTSKDNYQYLDHYAQNTNSNQLNRQNTNVDLNNMQESRPLQAIYVDENNNNNPDFREEEHPISIILDIDKMFKFRTYRKDFNYDNVLKRERQRIRQTLQYTQNRRRTTKSKPNLQFKARKTSNNNIEFGSQIRSNVSNRDQANSQQYISSEL